MHKRNGAFIYLNVCVFDWFLRKTCIFGWSSGIFRIFQKLNNERKTTRVIEPLNMKNFDEKN